LWLLVAVLAAPIVTHITAAVAVALRIAMPFQSLRARLTLWWSALEVLAVAAAAL
jgi:hypothetical protein